MKIKRHPADKFEDDGDKALWNLLGKTRKMEAGPMFSRNVLREIRLMEAKAMETGGGASFRKFFQFFQKPVFLVSAITALIFLGILGIENSSIFGSLVSNQQSLNQFQVLGSVEDVDPAMEFESIGMFGELMAVSDPGSLSDEALMNLLF